MSDIGKRYIDSESAYLLRFLEDQHKKTEELKKKLNTDPLTGLYSKSFMDAEGRILDYQRNEIPYGVFAIDVDSFKTSANDSYGHDVGDRVLVIVAEALKKTFRPTDACCRPGGDEFVVIMPEFNLETDPKNLQESLEERLTQHIHDTFLQNLSQYPKLMNIGISVGFASSRDASNFDEIKEIADLKMFESKKLKGVSR